MNQEIRRKLDHITDVLWAGGVTNPVTYIEQISYLIYLKLLDEGESTREIQKSLTGRAKSLYPDQAKRYRWSEWRFKSGEKLRDYVRDEVFPYMANSLVKDAPHVSDYFRDATLEILDPNVLKQVIDEIDTINFQKLGPDEKGDIFEYLLTHLGQSALNGQFRTPRQIRAMMVALVDPDFGDTIYDPACGTGGFLIDSLEYILAKYSEHPVEVPIYGEEWLEKTFKAKSGNGGEVVEVPKGYLAQLKKENPNLQTYRKGAGEKIPDWNLLEGSLYGVDVSRQMMRIATMNMVLHGVTKANIKRGNSLSEMGGLTEEDLRRKYSVILSNPPFAGVLPKDSVRKDLPTNSKKSELLFLSIMMESLAPGGRCAVVVPEGLLFGSTAAHVELRKKLVEELELLAVISLPAGVFKPYAGVKTGVLVFHRPKGAGSGRQTRISQQKVWFYEVRNDGYDPDKISGGGRPETPELSDIPGLLRVWNSYAESKTPEPPGPKSGTSLAVGAQDPKFWWAEVAMLAENDYNLAPSRYKPILQAAQEVADPLEIVDALISLESEIVVGLRTLQDELKNGLP